MKEGFIKLAKGKKKGGRHLMGKEFVELVKGKRRKKRRFMKGRFIEWARRNSPAVLMSAVFLLATAEMAMAGTDTTFDTVTTTVHDWATGSLGKALTTGTLLVGGGVAVATQSVKTAISATGLALVLAYGPDVLQGLFTALF